MRIAAPGESPRAAVSVYGGRIAGQSVPPEPAIWGAVTEHLVGAGSDFRSCVARSLLMAQ